MNATVVLAGAGNMGFAMLAGWLEAGRLSAAEVVAVEPNRELRERAAALGVAAVEAAEALPAGLSPKLVVFAVKPQVIRAVAAEYRRFAAGGTIFLSVAAGTRIDAFEAVLGPVPVVRCMPNTPAAIGKGMMVVVANDKVDEAALAFVNGLLATSGAVARVTDEAQMDAVTAVSGSGPAYVFHFIEALTAAGEAAGLPQETARQLALQTVYGAACLAHESGVDPRTLRQQVTSPNGTTAAALAVLMGEERLTRLVTEAVEAARLRAVELGR